MDFMKVVSIRELDEILPMIEKLHKDFGMDEFISLSGFITWISLKLPLANFNVWKITEESKTVGYVIAEITQRYFENECMIVDAYMEKNDTAFTKEMFTFVKDWAESNNCTILSCHTKRVHAMSRAYGFKPYGMIMMQRIGG